MGIIERKEREREARRTQILNAAQKVFEAQGLGQASMDEIAKEAELAKGTIYLYYKNKDELFIGLILRGFEHLYDMILAETSVLSRGIEKIAGVGNAYRRFSTEDRFLFSLMNVSEPPAKANISQELIDDLSHLSERIWKMFFGFTDEAKAEGDVRQDINGFTLVLTLWLSATGILRMYNKCICNTGGSVFSARKGGVKLEYLDWQYVYDHTMRMLMENAVTDQGRSHLQPLEWRPMELLTIPTEGHEFERLFSFAEDKEVVVS